MRRGLLPVAFLALASVLTFLGLRAGRDTAAASRSSGPGSGGAPTNPHSLTPVLSVRRIPAWLAAPAADARLRGPLDDIVRRSPPSTCLSVSAGGRVLYEHNPTLPLTPASAEKLVTAAAALDRLGPDRRIRTAIVSSAPIVDGEVRGDAYMVGGGDPILATGDYIDHFELQPQIRTSLEALADRMAKTGIKRITGRLIGDESRYDTQRYVSTWPERYKTQNQSGPLSALTVNDNFSDFPPQQVGGFEERPAPDPPSFAAQRLSELLDTRGVRTDGGIGAGPAPAGTKQLAAIDSPPVRDVVKEMLTDSDNQTAETLTKELGRMGSGAGGAKSGPGTTAAGVQAIRQIATRLGLPLDGTVTTDGSGLDEGNRVTCRFMSAALDRWGRHSPLGEALPVAGKTGTLTKRFLLSPVTGRLRAKTGTLNTVTALAGFVDTVPGTDLTFSYIAVGRPVNDELLRVQDDLGASLVRYPEGPTLVELGPIPG